MKLLILFFVISATVCLANTVTEKSTQKNEAAVETPNEISTSNIQKQAIPEAKQDPGKANNLWPAGLFGAGALPEEFPGKNLMKFGNK